MKIRTKFTLLISLVALLSASFFSAHLYRELKEEMYELIDYELADGADFLFGQLALAGDSSLPSISPPGFPLNGYWLRISTQSGATIYASTLAESSALSPAAPDKPHLETISVSHDRLNIPDSERDEVRGEPVKLRIRNFRRQIGETPVVIQIGKPVLLLNAELHEILFEMSIAIPFTILLIFLAAYLLAGRMLCPVAEINRRIARIRENSLHERIPLGQSKDELYTLSSSLNSMFDRLQNSFVRQREFIGNAAHEMRSPLTILMLGHEEMLAASPDTKLKSALEKQLNSMRRLNKLIRDLLSIARLEQEDTLVRTNVNITELLARVLEDYGEIITGRDLTVTMRGEPLPIDVDQEKIQRLFINLIDNGIKYNTERGGTLQISTRKERESAVVEITNSGRTIPPEDLKHIFKQFYRVEKSRSQAFGGTGLGLTIASRIVAMHGGNIEARSSDDVTTFTVTIPVHPLV